MKLKIIFKTSFLLLISVSLYAQSSQNIQIGTQFPLQHFISYENQFHPHWSVTAQAGVFTAPYKKMILKTLNIFCIDDALTSLLGDAVSSGAALQPTVKYHFKKNYFGLYYLWFSLKADESPRGALESYYNISLPNPPGSSTITELYAKCKAHNIGIMYGRRFVLKNTKMELRTEIGIAKTLGSESTIFTENHTFDAASQAVDVYLKDYLMEYGYVPTLNMMFVYKISN